MNYCIVVILRHNDPSRTGEGTIGSKDRINILQKSKKQNKGAGVSN